MVKEYFIEVMRKTDGSLAKYTNEMAVDNQRTNRRDESDKYIIKKMGEEAGKIFKKNKTLSHLEMRVKTW
ncbi:MAG: hypothetical protein WC781_04900 [Candidatus Pacearchaeota archaeon]|jgi:hypothetical protein